MAMAMASRGVSLCAVQPPPSSLSMLFFRRVPTTASTMFAVAGSSLQQWTSFRSQVRVEGCEMMMMMMMMMMVGSKRRRRSSSSTSTSSWNQQQHGFSWLRRIPSDENHVAAVADFGVLGGLGFHGEVEKERCAAEMKGVYNVHSVQPRGVRGSQRVPGLRFRVKDSKLDRLGIRSASLDGEHNLQSDDLQASVHDPQINADNANTFLNTDTSTRDDHLHQAGINNELREEESRNNPQSLSTSGDSKGPPNQKQQQWFPYEDSFKLNDETTLTSADVLRMLAPFLLDGRKQRIEEVVANRTYSVCPVVEGLLDLGNVSAVFRSADALGFQSVHVISNVSNRRYKKNRKVSAGAEKWLDVEMWESTGACIATLKARGYRIAVTHIAPDTVSIHDMDWRIPTAVFFGNEHKGVSAEAIALSDIRCSIPMAGMVDSFNVSVAAGILMHHAVHDRIARAGAHGDLTPRDRQVLEAEFSLRHNRQTVQILDRLVEKKEGIQKPSSLSDMLKGDFVSDIEDAEYLQV